MARQLTKREQYIFTVAMIAVAVYAGFNGIVKPLKGRIDLVEGRIAGKERQLNKYLRMIRRAKALEEDHRFYLDHFKQSGTDEEVMSAILSEIEEVSRKLGVSISDLKPKRVRNEEAYNSFSVSLAIKSEFPDILKFLHTIQRQPHLFNVEELRFDKQARRKSSSLKTRLVLRKILIP